MANRSTDYDRSYAARCGWAVRKRKESVDRAAGAVRQKLKLGGVPPKIACEAALDVLVRLVGDNRLQALEYAEFDPGDESWVEVFTRLQDGVVQLAEQLKEFTPRINRAREKTRAARRAQQRAGHK